MSRETGVSIASLRKYISTASQRYKTYRILKRTSGYRRIEHPARPLKFLQRWVVRELVDQLPVHECASAYHAGASIKANAEMHARQEFLLRIDFRAFFPSIRGDDIRQYCYEKLRNECFRYVEEDIELIISIVCRFNRLTIGSPSSPLISNAIMYNFDSHWVERARNLGCFYSRYADDVYFSTSIPNVLKDVLGELRDSLSRLPYPNLAIREAKVTFTSRKRRRVVTGVILTPEGSLSVGRERKRFIRSLVHRSIMGGLDRDQGKKLQGLLAFVHDVEPMFIDRLKRKFGESMSRIAPRGRP